MNAVISRLTCVDSDMNCIPSGDCFLSCLSRTVEIVSELMERVTRAVWPILTAMAEKGYEIACEVAYVVWSVLEVACEVALKVAEAALPILIWAAMQAFEAGKWLLKPLDWVFHAIGEYTFDEDTSYAGVILNHCNFHLAPDPIDMQQLTFLGEGVDVSDLETQYQLIAVADRESPHEVSLSSRSIARYITDLVELARRDGHPNTWHEDERRNYNYYQTYYSTIKKVVQNIVLELRKPEIDHAKKKRALMMIAEGMAGCRPRKLAECLRQYRLLKTTQSETQQLLLEYVQDFKEELFLETFQHGQFHIINYIRSRVGESFGLDTTSISLNDPFLHMGGQPTDCEIMQVFHTQYTTRRLIEGIHTRIQLDSNNLPLCEHILAVLGREAVARGENLENPDVAERIVDEGTNFFNGPQLNERGVIFLLKSIGILIPA